MTLGPPNPKAVQFKGGNSCLAAGKVQLSRNSCHYFHISRFGSKRLIWPHKYLFDGAGSGQGSRTQMASKRLQYPSCLVGMVHQLAIWNYCPGHELSHQSGLRTIWSHMLLRIYWCGVSKSRTSHIRQTFLPSQEMKKCYIVKYIRGHIELNRLKLYKSPPVCKSGVELAPYQNLEA